MCDFTRCPFCVFFPYVHAFLCVEINALLHKFALYQVNDEHEALQAQPSAQQPDGPV